MILPFSKPVRGTDGSDVYAVLVPKGTMVFPSFLSSNCNPDLWGYDSYEWKPERWVEGLPSSVTETKMPGVDPHLFVILLRGVVVILIHLTRMTFSGGKRACIGFKLAQLEMSAFPIPLPALCALLTLYTMSFQRSCFAYS